MVAIQVPVRRQGEVSLGTYPGVSPKDARERRGEARKKVAKNCGQIFRYAVATGRVERDPTGDLKGVLLPVKGIHFAAVTDQKKVAGVL